MAAWLGDLDGVVVLVVRDSEKKIDATLGQRCPVCLCDSAGEKHPTRELNTVASGDW
jgi:hypothetical protein